jgi:hypothetical protein
MKSARASYVAGEIEKKSKLKPIRQFYPQTYSMEAGSDGNAFTIFMGVPKMPGNYKFKNFEINSNFTSIGSLNTTANLGDNLIGKTKEILTVRRRVFRITRENGVERRALIEGDEVDIEEEVTKSSYITNAVNGGVVHYIFAVILAPQNIPDTDILGALRAPIKTFIGFPTVVFPVLQKPVIDATTDQVIEMGKSIKRADFSEEVVDVKRRRTINDIGEQFDQVQNNEMGLNAIPIVEEREAIFGIPYVPTENLVFYREGTCVWNQFGVTVDSFTQTIKSITVKQDFRVVLAVKTSLPNQTVDATFTLKYEVKS